MNLFRRIPWHSRAFLMFLIVLALARDVISNGSFKRNPSTSKPILVLIPFSAQEKDSTNLSKPPGSVLRMGGHTYCHWLGTDDYGRDVAAGLVAGARVAIQTALTAMGVAFLLGLLLGSLAGFYGDDGLEVEPIRCIAAGMGIMIGILWAFILRIPVLQHDATGKEWLYSILFFGVLSVLFWAFGRLISLILPKTKKWVIPADLIIMRAAEITHAIPKLILLLTCIAIIRSPFIYWILLVIIGLFSWPGIAFYVRSSLLKVRALDYIHAARGMGMSELRVLWRHGLPNALQSAWTACALGMGSAILLEVSLSFLGLDTQLEGGASWGRFLAHGSLGFRAWWVTMPAAAIICGTILAINSVGSALNEIQS